MFTMDGWEDADEVRDDTKGGDYVRLKDGDDVIVVFPEKPFAYRQVWLTAENRSELYDPEKHDGMRPQGRFMFPVFVKTGETEYTPKLFDASGETYDTIKKVLKKYTPKAVFELSREGSGTDTKYSVLLERKLEGGELDHVSSLEPLDAEKAVLGGESEPSTTPEGGDPWDKS